MSLRRALILVMLANTAVWALIIWALLRIILG